MSEYILIVEDDENAIELNRRAFAEHGRFDVVAYQRGQDAIDYLRRTGEFENRPEANPALVILDLGLPDLPGIDVLRSIRSDETLRHLPVVVLSVSEDPSDVQEALEEGANFFITKPVRSEEFEEAVRVISAFWSTSVQIPTLPKPRF